jgi:ubiquinone/menaquinone biosynthesis C-methylase UbiE
VAVTDVYDTLVTAWDRAAGLVYRPMARSLVDASPVPLSGQLVLDVGCGTGAVTEAAVAIGARVLAVDRSLGMVGHVQGRGWSAIVADALALPFGPDRFDGALAGFLLNHLSPGPVLAELARVVRVGGVILGTTWNGGRPDPVKTAIDGTLASRGWVRPGWYETIKSEVEPVSGDPSRLAEAAEEAGLVDVVATPYGEDLPVRDPRAVVEYRLAMPHIAPWVAGLDQSEYTDLRREAVAAVVPHVSRWRPESIILTGRVGSHEK